MITMCQKRCFLTQLIPTKFRQVNHPPERNLASFKDFLPLLLSLMVSDWFSEVFNQQKSDIAKLVFYSYHHLITLFITTFIADFGLRREPSVIFECCYFSYFFVFFCVFYISEYLIISVILNEKGQCSLIPYQHVHTYVRLVHYNAHRPQTLSRLCTRVRICVLHIHQKHEHLLTSQLTRLTPC